MDVQRIDVQMALLGVRWPATKAALVQHVTETGVPVEVGRALRTLPEEPDYHYSGSTQVLSALGLSRA